MMKSQVATEYIIIVGFIIVVLVPITILYMRYSSESSDTVTASKVEYITNEIVTAADSVYAYGEGSQIKIEVDFPSNIKEIEFAGKEVIFTVINSKNQEIEIVQVADIELEGNITVMPGKKEIIVKSLGNSVSVTMPCEEGESECITCQIGGYNGPCLYECINKVMTLTDLCENSNCNEGCQTVFPEACSVGTCTSVYQCSGTVYEPCGGLNVCCDIPSPPICENEQTVCGNEIGFECAYPPETPFYVQNCLYVCQDNNWVLDSFCSSCSNGMCTTPNSCSGPDISCKNIPGSCLGNWVPPSPPYTPCTGDTCNTNFCLCCYYRPA